MEDRPSRAKPLLVVNPVQDEAFVEAVERAVAAGASEPITLQRALRATYPATVVRERGLSDEAITVLYVYRDGHWVAGTD